MSPIREYFLEEQQAVDPTQHARQKRTAPARSHSQGSRQCVVSLPVMLDDRPFQAVTSDFDEPQAALRSQPFQVLPAPARDVMRGANYTDPTGRVRSH
jgi:hypothetical protein